MWPSSSRWLTLTAVWYRNTHYYGSHISKDVWIRSSPYWCLCYSYTYTFYSYSYTCLVGGPFVQVLKCEGKKKTQKHGNIQHEEDSYPTLPECVMILALSADTDLCAVQLHCAPPPSLIWVQATLAGLGVSVSFGKLWINNSYLWEITKVDIYTACHIVFRPLRGDFICLG